MTFFYNRFTISLCVALLWPPIQAWATPISYVFEGTVGGVQTELSSDFHIGDSMSGVLTFASEAPGTHPAVGLGFYTDPISAFIVTISGKTYSLGNGTGPGSFIQVMDNWSSAPARDGYDFGAQLGGYGVLPNLVPRLFQIGLMTATDLSSVIGDALPGTEVTLADFTSGVFIFNFGPIGPGPNFKVDGNLTRFAAVSSAVPEPASVVLLSLGLIGLGFCRRKSQPMGSLH